MSRVGSAAVLAAAPRQLRLIALLSLLPGLVLVLCIPLLASVQNLNQQETSMVLDRLFSLSGILALTPLARPEQDKSIREAVSCKRTGLAAVLLLRVLWGVLWLALLTLGLCGAMALAGCTFPFVPFALGAFATALVLGALGLAGAVVSDNWVIGYLFPVCWFFLCYGGGAFLGPFNLFTLYSGNYADKLFLGALGLVLLAATFVWLRVKARRVGTL